MHRRDFFRSLSIAAAVGLPGMKLSAQKVESGQIPDLVAADRILAAHEIADAYGHVSVRSDQNPQHFFMSRSLAPELVTADDVQRIAQTFFDPKQIALTVLGNLENFKIGREDLAC